MSGICVDRATAKVPIRSGLSPLGRLACNMMAPDEGNMYLLGKVALPNWMPLPGAVRQLRGALGLHDRTGGGWRRRFRFLDGGRQSVIGRRSLAIMAARRSSPARGWREWPSRR
ncbi:hypothetical protein HY78_18425 [Rhizorhabdus wittichii DC-6]|nr:hypothetical protein HY78_18425 [Rhizorhabdus wittichii DC-6]